MHKTIVSLIVLLFLAACDATPATPYPDAPPPSAQVTELPEVNWPSRHTSPLGTPEPDHATTPEPTPAAVLPVAFRCVCDCPTPTATPTPTETPIVTDTVTIYDCDGAISNVAWLESYFGAVVWTEPAPGGARLATLRASCGDAPAVLVAHVEDAQGQPAEGVTVVFHWLDAPMLPAELRSCGLDRGVYGPTNINGDIGFGLGGGSYYRPALGETGPHTIWIAGTDSACLAGLGMIAETNHHHLDSGWALAAGGGAAAAVDWGFGAFCPVYLEDVPGYGEMWVIRCP